MDENSGIVDACNQLIDELNAYGDQIASLEKVNGELKCMLASKKRTYESFSNCMSPGSSKMVPLKKLKENKEDKENQMPPVAFNLYTPKNTGK